MTYSGPLTCFLFSFSKRKIKTQEGKKLKTKARIKSKPERNSNDVPVDDICKGQPCYENIGVRILRREMMWKLFSCSVYIYIFTGI